MQFKFKQIIFLVLQNIIGGVKNIISTNLAAHRLALVLCFIVLSIELYFGQSVSLADDKQFIIANKRFYTNEYFNTLDNALDNDRNTKHAKKRILSTSSLRSTDIKAYIKVSLSMGSKQIINICREARSKGLEKDFSFLFTSSAPDISLIHSLASNGCSFVIGEDIDSKRELASNTKNLVPDVINIAINKSLCEGQESLTSKLCQLLVSPYGSSIRNNWAAETIGGISTNIYSEFAIKQSYSDYGDYGSSINGAVFQKRLNSSRSKIILKLQKGYLPVLNRSIQ